VNARPEAALRGPMASFIAPEDHHHLVGWLRAVLGARFLTLGVVSVLATVLGRVVPALAETAAAITPLEVLLLDARERNPELLGAAREIEAAQARTRVARALEDPMAEVGLLNVPTPSWSFREDDMTMKMLGLSQRLPFPGKRDLRAAVAAQTAEAAEANYRDTLNRIVRDLKVAYTDLGFTFGSIEIVQRNKVTLAQLLQIAETRYTVGQGTQADVLKAQTELAIMNDELIQLERERLAMTAEIARLAARDDANALVPQRPALSAAPADLSALEERAIREQPRLQGLAAAMMRQEKAVELARREYYPDFDVRLSYAQRDPDPAGMPRDNMVNLSLAVNLPLWRKSKLAPMVAEAQAMREQAARMLEAERLMTRAAVRQQHATLEQSAKSARLYETSILPQARLTLEAALAAYRVNRVDFLTLLDNQMTVFNQERALLEATSRHENALAELEYWVGGRLSAAEASSGDSP